MLPWPQRPPRRVAGIPIGLLVCWQVALLLALVAIGRPAGHVIVFGVGAAALIAATGMRPGGHWMHEWVALRLRYLCRGLRVPAPGRQPELALLDLAARVETIENVEIEGHEAAVIFHATGGTAVLELDLDQLRPDQGQLPLTLVPLHDHDPDAPATCVQLLLQTAPGQPVRAWLAVQVRRESGFRVDELRGALVSTVRRLQRRLRADGLDAPALDRARLLDAVRDATCLALAGPVPPGDASAVGTEQWQAWWTRGVPQTSLAVRRWSGAPEPPSAALLDTLLRSQWPQTISIAAQRTRMPTGHGAVGAGTDVVATELLVRVAGPDRSTLEAATRQLRDRLAAAGASVERLDGRQLPGFAATLPLGGFLPGYPPSAAAFAPPPKLARPGNDQPAGPAGPAAPELPAPAAPPEPAAPAPPPTGSPPVELPTAPVGMAPPVATAGTAAAEHPQPPASTEPPPRLPARGQAQLPALPPPALGRAVAPGTPAFRGSVHPPVSPAAEAAGRGRARVPAVPAPRDPAVLARPSEPPTALRGATAGPAPPIQPTSPPTTGGAPPPSYQIAANPHGAVRAYGASLFTAESPHRAWAEQLVALARTPHSAPQAVSVLAGRRGIGASTTAAGLARTLATVRDDHTALLSVDAGSANPSTILEVCRDHAFTVVDLGAHAGEATPQAVALSTRVVVVTGADRYATSTTRLLLDRIHRVRPELVGGAVVAVVCTTARQYRRVLRELGDDLTPQAAQIVPIPHDPALRTMKQPDLTQLRTPTREAYLRLAASLASPRPAAAATGPQSPHVPTHL